MRGGAGTGATTAPDATHPSEVGETGDMVLALALLWSKSEPARAGEVALVEPSSGPAILGRGPSPNLLSFIQQRPGHNGARPPLDAPSVSRQQVRLVARNGALVAENIGRASMLVNGEAADKGVLVPGDTLELKKEALFLVVERPVLIPALRAMPASLLGPYGAPDADGIIGEAPAVHRLRDNVAFAAEAEGHILLTGDSGTGKELAARALHARSSRSDKPFISRNAATLPPGIVDAELFGNAKNYPNAGVGERMGLIGEAHQGVLFLDEIGELPLELQAHLLRLLDSGEYHRLGESLARRSDVRVIGATNRDPSALKHDLVARFTLRIATPPLAERREDIPLVARHLLSKMAAGSPKLLSRFRDDQGDFRFSSRFVQQLVQHAYPGNIRDLQTLLWAAVSESPRDRLDRAGSLSAPREAPRPSAAETPPAREDAPEPTPEAIRKAVADAKGKLTVAAAALNMNRFALYRLLRRHGIDADELRSNR